MNKIEKIKEKIKKLLRLSSSPEKYEAELALKKAQALMEEYQLSLDIDDFSDNQIIEKPLDKAFTKQGAHLAELILRVINEICGVDSLQRKVFLKRSYTRNWSKYGKSKDYYISIYRWYYTLVGRKENIEVAEYIFFHLLQVFPLIWNNYRKTENEKYSVELYKRKDKNDFYTGLAMGIIRDAKKEKEMRKNQNIEKYEIIQLYDQELENYMQKYSLSDKQKEIMKLFQESTSKKLKDMANKSNIKDVNNKGVAYSGINKAKDIKIKKAIKE